LAEPSPLQSRYSSVLKALRRYRNRIHRVVLARQRDLEGATEAPGLRLAGEALLTYLKEVKPRARRVDLPDPHGPDRKIAIELDPMVSAQVNAARYFKRAARAERGLEEIPRRLAEAQAEQEKVERAIARLEAMAPNPEADSFDSQLEGELNRAVDLIPAALRENLGIAPSPRSATATKQPSEPQRGGIRAPSARLQPRQVKSDEGWDVLIGRNNDGNDYLTLHIARPEDYWFHVHGAAGSHVVLRRGKGKNEPSKQTIEEVASWTAFHSQARNAGKVPVIFTRKKYVRKPRGAKPGTVVCEREKTVMVRPKEPPEPKQ